MGQSIFSNALIASIGRVATIVLGLISTALIVRSISIPSFGVYSFVLTIGIVFQLIADFGLYLTASREIGASGGNDEHVMGHIVALRIVLLGAVFLVGLVGFMFVPTLQKNLILFTVLSLGLIAQSISQLLMGVFQAHGVVWRATVGDITGRSVQVVLLGALFWKYGPGGASQLGVAVAFTLSLGVALCVHLILVPALQKIIPRVSMRAWKKIAASSWPLAIMLILNVLYFRIDIVILSFFRTEQEVGWYSLAYKIIENGLFFPAMLGGLLLPHISSAIAARNTRRAEQIISEGVALVIYGGLLLVLVLIVFAQPIVLLIAGEGFAPSVALLRILALALASMFVGNIFGFTLIALSEQRKLLVLYGVLVVANSIGNWLLVPSYGALAASWVTVATECTAMFVAALIIRKYLAWRLSMRMLCGTGAAAAVSLYVGMVLPEHVHISVRLFVVGVLYAWVGYVFGIWSKKSLAALRTLSGV